MVVVVVLVVVKNQETTSNKMNKNAPMKVMDAPQGFHPIFSVGVKKAKDHLRNQHLR